MKREDRVKNAIDSFLTTLAETLDYPLDDLTIKISRCRRGSIDSVDSSSKEVLRKYEVKHNQDVYPALSNVAAIGGVSLNDAHLYIRIVLDRGGLHGTDRKLFTFNHHMMPGNCGIAVHRLVSIRDNKKLWPGPLQEAAFLFRVRLARAYGYKGLIVTEGKSHKSDEIYSKFDHVFCCDRRSGSGKNHVYTLDIERYLRCHG